MQMPRAQSTSHAQPLADLLARPVLIGCAKSDDSGEALLPESSAYICPGPGAGLQWIIKPGALLGIEWLSADLLLAGDELVTMVLRLREGADGPAFELVFNLLAQAQARMRVPLAMTDFNTWKLPREGAWMKPRCRGSRVDLRRVDRIELLTDRMSERPARWYMTALKASQEPPPLLVRPILPAGPHLDEMGQSLIRRWPGRTGDVPELARRLRAQLDDAPRHAWPAWWSRWGGDAERRWATSGFFRSHHDGRRWWMVDPDGHPFWSTGLDCIRVDASCAYQGLTDALTWLPDAQGVFAGAYGGKYADIPEFKYLAANFIRVFGPEQWRARWESITLGLLRRFGFNSVGNFSDWQAPHHAGFPYVRMVGFAFQDTPLLYRDLPDVFDERFLPEAGAQAETLRQTVDDPALIGYFLMNEPRWGFASESPAEGMLFNTTACRARVELAAFLRGRWGDDAGLSRAWGMEVRLEAVERGVWRGVLTTPARRDLEDFSAILCRRFFQGLSDVCREIDSHHLNLGVRFQVVPPPFALSAMSCFDVFSMNCYKDRVPADVLDHVARVTGRPTIIGEWHFGALDAGVPGSGIGRVATQADRGRAYRVYLEHAAAQPNCIGTHYFTLYDQSALGRFDGENYQIGLLDICNRPYDPICEAARQSHERLYAIARAEVPPFADAPQYLSKLF